MFVTSCSTCHVFLCGYISCPLSLFLPFRSLFSWFLSLFGFLNIIIISFSSTFLPYSVSLLSSSPPFALFPPFSPSPSVCLFNLCGCLMKSLLKWTIVALRIFIERNNQPGCVCLHYLPPFKEIISGRQDCESSELWAKQQANRIGSREPWVNNTGIMGTAAANVYYYD